MPPSVNPSIKKEQLKGLDEIEVVTLPAASLRRTWFYFASQLLLMQTALIAGVVLTIYGARGAGQDFKVLLLSMATLCVGFGAGSLVYRRIEDTRADELRTEFRDLRVRADNLIEKIDSREHASAETSPAAEPGRSLGRP